MKIAALRSAVWHAHFTLLTCNQHPTVYANSLYTYRHAVLYIQAQKPVLLSSYPYRFIANSIVYT